MRTFNRDRDFFAGALLVAAFGLLEAGCTLVADLDIKQCRKDSDCAKYGQEFAEYACIEEICQPFSCETDKQCQDRGGTFANYICESSSCIVPYCTTDAQCQEENPSATCNSGRCVDEKWGCLYDDVPPPRAPQTIRFAATIKKFFFEVPPKNLQAFVCEGSDSDCAAPFDESRARVVVNQNDGRVEITLYEVKSGGFKGFFRFTGDDILPLHFYFGTPLRSDRVTDRDTPILALFPGAASMLGMSVQAPQEFDDVNFALLTNRIYDCTGRPVTGLRIRSKEEPEAPWYKSTESYVPSLEEPTDTAGIAGLANVKPALHTMEIVEVKSDRVVYDYPLITRPGVFYLSFLYPNDLDDVTLARVSQ